MTGAAGFIQRSMKKFVIAGVACLLCVVLTACEPRPFHYKQEELREEVTSIELINYDNPNSRMVSDHFSQA